jgi:hypothetical protein
MATLDDIYILIQKILEMQTKDREMLAKVYRAVAWDLDSTAGDFEQITVSTTAKKLTSATYRAAEKAFASVDTAGIYYRLDGGTTTSSKGNFLPQYAILELRNKSEIANFSAIRQGAVDAVINVTYYSLKE